MLTPPAATVANAQTTQQWCGDQGICFQVNVPSNGKDLFFQISGPSSMSWIGLGQGSGMVGANIFLIYPNSAGTNVTLSTRLGTGHVEPQASTDAQATLLDGSMVTGDKMIANIKCKPCPCSTNYDNAKKL
jgi:Cytochrome domain of cellobiose dehydrogenase